MKVLLAPVFNFFQRLVTLGVSVAIILPLSLLAFYSDLELAPAQTFSATTLQFAQYPAPLPPITLSDLGNNYSFTLPTAFTADSTAANYDITVTATGTTYFCDRLNLTATGYLGAVSGTVYNFNTPILNSGPEWQLTLSYINTVADYAPGAQCLLTVAVSAWQANMSKGSGGYQDSYVLNLVVELADSPVSLNSLSALLAGGFIEDEDAKDGVDTAEVVPEPVAEGSDPLSVVPDPESLPDAPLEDRATALSSLPEDDGVTDAKEFTLPTEEEAAEVVPEAKSPVIEEPAAVTTAVVEPATSN